MKHENGDPAGREQRISILLDAPVALVWEVCTRPEHIIHWWGPEGFTNTIDEMNVVPGGEWVFTMYGPDGNNYPNRILFREVESCRKLVHEHFVPNFMAFLDFERKGDKTLLNWYKLYETRELFELVEIQYKSNIGFAQTVEKLKKYLSQVI